MRPFSSVSAVIDWFCALESSQPLAPCGVLVDFTAIDRGIQRREIVQQVYARDGVMVRGWVCNIWRSR